MTNDLFTRIVDEIYGAREGSCLCKLRKSWILKSIDGKVNEDKIRAAIKRYKQQDEAHQRIVESRPDLYD